MGFSLFIYFMCIEQRSVAWFLIHKETNCIHATLSWIAPNFGMISGRRINTEHTHTWLEQNKAKQKRENQKFYNNSSWCYRDVRFTSCRSFLFSFLCWLFCAKSCNIFESFICALLCVILSVYYVFLLPLISNSMHDFKAKTEDHILTPSIICYVEQYWSAKMNSSSWFLSNNKQLSLSLSLPLQNAKKSKKNREKMQSKQWKKIAFCLMIKSK